MGTIIKKPFALLGIVLAFVASGYVLCAAQPTWWTEYSLIDGTNSEDAAIATIGQAKHVVQKAYQYLETELASVGGAGAEVTNLCNSYCATAPADPDDDLQLLTVGQLKYLAKPFYDRLNSAEVGLDTSAMNEPPTDIYPWTVDQTDDEDLALVALGQLKFVFSFDLSAPVPVITNRTNWYIDTVDGNDTTGNGNPAFPLQSLSALWAINTVNPGYVGTDDTVYLAAGNYGTSSDTIAIAGLTMEGTLDVNGESLTQMNNLQVTADNVTVKNLDFNNTSLELKNVSGVLVTNNLFTGSTGISLSLLGSSNNTISYNRFESAQYHSVMLSWDSAGEITSDDNQFIRNYFTHRTSATTNESIYCTYSVGNNNSLNARNRFIECAFEETVSGGLIRVITDEGTWWMTDTDTHPYQYSVRFEDCYFKRADRAAAFSEFVVTSEWPDLTWRWDELANDTWVSTNYQYAITGDYNDWNLEPRIQFIDSDDNGSIIETSHNAGLLYIDTDDDGLRDNWEQQIVDANVSDGIKQIEDVLPGDDFDLDGLSNQKEFEIGSDPTNSDSDNDTYLDGDEYFADTGVLDDQSFPDLIGIAPWQTSTLGDINTIDSKSYIVDENLVLLAGGWGLSSHDRIGFFHQSISGDFSLAVRVHDISGQGTGYFGLMARQSLERTALYTALYTGKADGTYFMHRARPSEYGIYEGFQERVVKYDPYLMYDTSLADVPEILTDVPGTLEDTGRVIIAKLNDNNNLNILVRFVSPGDKTDYFYSDDINHDNYNPNIIELLAYLDSTAGTPWELSTLSTDEKDKIVNDSRLFTNHIRGVLPNYWMKLERKGDLIVGYTSADGNSWFARGSQMQELVDPIQAGFFLFSENNTIRDRAIIELVEIRTDEDRDGLWSDEEIALGTDPNLTDTDGDGVDDFTEVKVTLTDPLVAEFDGTVTSIVNVSGSSYVDNSGDWLKDGNEVYARSQRGWVEYDITLPNSGTFRLDFSGGQENAYSSEDRFDIALYLNGQWVGRKVLEAAYPNLGTISFYLPLLDSGTHRFRMEWINGEPQTSLKITDLDVVELGGVDLNGNEIPDWVESRITSASDLDTTTVQTLVSPYTLEGQSLFIDTVEVVGSYEPDPANPQTIVTQQGLKGNYFAHVPLAPDADTTITVTDQGGLFQSQKTVIWEATNVLEVSDFKIRTGDSLLLSGFDNANPSASDPVVITIDDSNGTQVASYAINSDEAVTHEFDLSDTYTINATLTPATGNPQTATISIDVVSVNFGIAPRVVVGETRNWTLPYLPDDAFLEADTSLFLEEVTNADNNVNRTFTLATSSSDESTILARLGENGPIIERVTVYPLVDYHYTESKWILVETFADGSVLWSATINLGGVISDNMEIHLNLYKAGVTFLDGTISKVITAADLDESGNYRYYMLNPLNTPGSTCHNIVIYQGNERLNNPN